MAEKMAFHFCDLTQKALIPLLEKRQSEIDVKVGAIFVTILFLFLEGVLIEFLIFL
jgi:hypothetical protein